MTLAARRRLAQRLDLVIVITLAVSAGLAALLFSIAALQGDAAETDTETTAGVATPLDTLPEIVEPLDGSVVMAGDTLIQGSGPANTGLQIIDSTGQILATTTSDTAGQWAVTLPLEPIEQIELTAQVATAPDQHSQSIKLVVESATLQAGASSKPDSAPDALAAGLMLLLFMAVAFTLFYARRLLYGTLPDNNTTPTGRRT